MIINVFVFCRITEENEKGEEEKQYIYEVIKETTLRIISRCRSGCFPVGMMWSLIGMSRSPELMARSGPSLTDLELLEKQVRQRRYKDGST